MVQQVAQTGVVTRPRLVADAEPVLGPQPVHELPYRPGQSGAHGREVGPRRVASVQRDGSRPAGSSRPAGRCGRRGRSASRAAGCAGGAAATPRAPCRTSLPAPAGPRWSPPRGSPAARRRPAYAARRARRTGVRSPRARRGPAAWSPRSGRRSCAGRWSSSAGNVPGDRFHLHARGRSHACHRVPLFVMRAPLITRTGSARPIAVSDLRREHDGRP